MYTTMESQSLDSNFKASDFKAPMAGFGYGLPLSRLVRVFPRGERFCCLCWAHLINFILSMRGILEEICG
jgi:hypothetical protein